MSRAYKSLIGNQYHLQEDVKEAVSLEKELLATTNYQDYDLFNKVINFLDTHDNGGFYIELKFQLSSVLQCTCNQTYIKLAEQYLHDILLFGYDGARILAYEMLCSMYDTSSAVDVVNSTKHFKYLKALVENYGDNAMMGCKVNIYNLADCYYYGYGTTKNTTLANIWYNIFINICAENNLNVVYQDQLLIANENLTK